MKYFLFILIVCNTKAFCQPNNVVLGNLKPFLARTLLFDSIDFSSCEQSYKNAVTSRFKKHYIIDQVKCLNRTKDWYQVVQDGNEFYVEKFYFEDTVSINEELAALLLKYPNISDRKTILTKHLINRDSMEKEEEKSIEMAALRTEDSLRKEYHNLLVGLRNKNKVIWDWSWSYPSEYSSFAEVSIEVLNTFKQKIKYIWFTFNAFNPVDDPIRDGFKGGYDVTVRGIGPVEFGEKANWNFESVFYSKTIQTMRIKQLKIQFFDGTIKTIIKPLQIKTKEEAE